MWSWDRWVTCSNMKQVLWLTAPIFKLSFLPHVPVPPTLSGPETFTFTLNKTINVKMHLYSLGIHSQCHLQTKNVGRPQTTNQKMNDKWVKTQICVSYGESRLKKNRMITMWQMHLLSPAYIPLLFPLHIIIAFLEAWKELPGFTLSFQEFQKNTSEPFSRRLCSFTNVIDCIVRTFEGII